MDYFGPDSARQSVTDRQLRSEFNLQVSVPVALHFLNLLNTYTVEKASVSFDEIFASSLPSERLLTHFEERFGFSLTDIRWEYNRELISKIVETTFDTLVGKIAAILSYYGCDIVLLTGRPTTLKPLSDLFLKYYAVSPNRLIALNNYRVGTWYPIHDGKGYLKDSKSIVAVGAKIGYLASARGSLNGFSLDLSELVHHMNSTTDYFTTNEYGAPFITPDTASATIKVSELPLRIWTRQLNTPSYPTRPFYMLEINTQNIEENLTSRYGFRETDRRQLKDALIHELDKLTRRAPFDCCIERDAFANKELLTLVSVTDREGDDIPLSFFDLHVQSMSETENYWLDSGAFTNLNIN
jgi:hypothetical protein